MSSEPRCEVCGTELRGSTSYDMWVFQTSYDEDGEPTKTMIDVGGEVTRDYVSVGAVCCGEKVRKEWNNLIRKLGVR